MRWRSLTVAWMACFITTGCLGGRSSAGGSASGAGGSAGPGGGAEGNGAGGSPTTGPFVFEQVAPASSLRKLSTLLTGAAPTDADYAAYAQDPNALAGIVERYMASPAYRDIMLRFFSGAFQQGQVKQTDFVQMFDREDHLPEAPLLRNMRESFARTVLALNDEGASFAQTMTTRRFMMTTELMSHYAYTDTSTSDDQGNKQTRWYTGNDNFGPTLQQAAGPVSTDDAANPASAKYLTFYAADLAAGYKMRMGDTPGAAVCASGDPLVFSKHHTLVGPGTWGGEFWSLLHAGEYHAWYPTDDSATGTLCYSGTTGSPSLWTAADNNDWRMVEIRAPAAGEALTEFFDMKRLRNGNTLLMQADRVGFFTTPAFLAQWGNNASNSSRAAVNQTLIAALGHQFDGNDILPLTTPTAVDPNHAHDPACFACHQSLDPMRQYLRQSYSLSLSRQADANQLALPAAFAFRGVKAGGVGAVGLGQALAGHPALARAWTLKLCRWLNSGACSEDDPEVTRIAKLFVDSGLKFDVMARAMYLSPLVTYAAPTSSVTVHGQRASIARREQLCAVLSSRLGLPDVCLLASASPDGQDAVDSRAAALPSDGYSRGVDQALYVASFDPFYVGNLENICSLLSARLVDGDVSWATASNADAALDKLVAQLLAVAPDQRPQPRALLGQHFSAAEAAGADATHALRSTFVAACSSVLVATVGQ